MADWDETKTAALKILGKDAEVPDLPATIIKASETFGKANDSFKTSREDCESKLLEIENAGSAMKNAIQQFQAKVEKSDFKLDLKDKDNAKKIQQAQKLLSSKLAGAMKHADDNGKMLNELDKHLIQLGKYKPSTKGL